jgi:hypothetical protein
MKASAAAYPMPVEAPVMTAFLGSFHMMFFLSYRLDVWKADIGFSFFLRHTDVQLHCYGLYTVLSMHGFRYHRFFQEPDRIQLFLNTPGGHTSQVLDDGGFDSFVKSAF